MAYDPMAICPQETKYYIDEVMSDALTDLDEKLRDHLTDYINLLVAQRIEESQKQFLTADEASDYLGVKIRTLNNWAKEGTLPRHKLGGKYYWSIDDIYENMEREE